MTTAVNLCKYTPLKIELQKCWNLKKYTNHPYSNWSIWYSNKTYEQIHRTYLCRDKLQYHAKTSTNWNASNPKKFSLPIHPQTKYFEIRYAFCKNLQGMFS